MSVTKAANVTGAADTLVDGYLVDNDPAEVLDECCDARAELLNLLVKYLLKCHDCSFS